MQWRKARAERDNILLLAVNVLKSQWDRSVVESFTALRQNCKLIDGWQRNNMNGKPQYSFRTQKRTGTNTRSRIDRIYLKDSLYDLSYEWKIVNSGIPKLDHYMITAYIATKDTPYIGKGRSTIGDFILEFKEVQEMFRKRTLKLMQDLEMSYETRSEEHNPQTLWKEYKTDLLSLARDFSRKRVSRIDKEIEMWEARKTKILGVENLEDNEDEL
ncbi:hypothetical protein DFP72DRAFT_817506, partial [Ephemerocybe angulata]